MRDYPRACKTAGEIHVGDRIEIDYQITDADVEKFAEISGDWNPIHFDEEYAKNTIFKKRIAHGMVSLAKFSGIFGMDLPGLGTLWEEQEIRFSSPVFLNESYKAIAEVSAVDRRRVTLDTWVEDPSGNKVLEGRATVIPASSAMRRKLQP